MKNLILITTASIMMSACNQAELDKSKMENQALLRSKDSLTIAINERESSINEFMATFNEVERNLDSVAVRQQVIYLNASKGRGDLKPNQKERINAEIAAINNMMDENRQKIASLTKKLKSSRNKNAQFEKTIATLNEQLAQKDMELAALNEKLNSLNAQVAQLQTAVDTLNTQYTSKSQTIAERTEALHTAYYVVGKAKDLKEAKVIDRKGGLLGIGKTSKLSGNVNSPMFTRIDYTKTSTIPVNSDGVKIISTHPTDSYKLETEGKDKDMVKNLVITNPEKFWSISKYLVIQGSPVSGSENNNATSRK